MRYTSFDVWGGGKWGRDCCVGLKWYRGQALHDKPFSIECVMFKPRIDILPESQMLLWPELSATPKEFILYGGTAVALQLGHRFCQLLPDLQLRLKKAATAVDFSSVPLMTTRHFEA